MNPVLPRRGFLSLAAGAGAAALLPYPVARAFAAAAEAKSGWAGYDRAVVIDTLGSPGGSIDDDSNQLNAQDFVDIGKSGLTAVNLTVNSQGVGSYARGFDATIDEIAYWNSQIAAHPDRLLQVRRAADLAEAKRSNRLGLIYGFQDATPFGENLDRLDTFWNLGVRVYQLTYNKRNLVGDGCLEPGNAGLSAFGRKLVEKLNERKALIDLSHAGERTTLEATAASKAPIAITHTGCAAINANPRNKTDNELKQVAAKGGYVGIYLMPFLRGKGQPMATDLIAHIEHAVEVCGEDHVGIGTDGSVSPVAVTEKFKKDFAKQIENRRKAGISAPGEDPSVYTFLPDLNRADRFARIAELLAARKHSDARIAKILGGNFARLLNDVWGA
ncbi:MAG: membrane dipeptidase [Rudaea sp.]|uniref:dipeptidase n=1 Tax=unclassified Rudaea TaxID=2627037 RepID=UPI001485A004|nr:MULTISPECIES: membrane dipeptidase [unclassified Rudaea]MBN8887796.1 membrane dipeptidase [Rudaea sp.]